MTVVARPDADAQSDLHAALDRPADFHCIGGFVVSHYGFARETADLDVLTVIPPEAAQRVADLAGGRSDAGQTHGEVAAKSTPISAPASNSGSPRSRPAMSSH